MNTQDPLDRFLLEVRDGVRAQADQGGRVRDFAAMIARARSIDPDAVSAEALADVTCYAPVVALRPPAARSDAPAPALARAEPPPAARGEAPVPACAELSPAHRPRWWRLGSVAAAAMIALALVGAARLARQDSDPRSGHAVQHSTSSDKPLVPLAAPAASSAAAAHAPTRPDPTETDHENMSSETFKILDTPPPAPIEPALEGMSSETFPHPDTPSPAPIEPALEGMSSETFDSPVPPKPASATPEPAADASWRELDRRAHEAWRRGDLARARRLLTSLIDSDAPPGQIELAYGDLFVLARQAGDPSALGRAWRAYLARFPGGLFAEDASAGLCRRDGHECWQRHLTRWPDGAHAAEARDSIDSHHQAP